MTHVHKTQPFVRPNGDSYDLSPAAVLLMAADTLHGDPAETTEQGRRNAKAMIDGLMAAAAAGGYPQCDILMTKLARGDSGPEVIQMAMTAMRQAGNHRVLAVMAKNGLHAEK